MLMQLLGRTEKLERKLRIGVPFGLNQLRSVSRLPRFVWNFWKVGRLLIICDLFSDPFE